MKKVWLFSESDLATALQKAVVEGMPPGAQANIVKFLHEFAPSMKVPELVVPPPDTAGV